MTDFAQIPEYVPANNQDVQSLILKLAQFSQSLEPGEQSLLMERIKRSLPNAEVQAQKQLDASPEVFAAWINTMLTDSSRWHPS